LELIRIWKKSEPARTLTSWRGQTLQLVRTWKESEPGRDTYNLERIEVVIGQKMERNQASKGHLQSGESRGWD